MNIDYEHKYDNPFRDHSQQFGNDWMGAACGITCTQLQINKLRLRNNDLRIL